MPPLTEEYVNAQTEQILRAVKSGFDGVAAEFTDVRTQLTDVRSQMSEQRQDIALIKESLVSLTALVDRFAKIYTDLNQELTVLRQHVRDMEARLGKVELKLAT